MKHAFNVTVECDGFLQAESVLRERLGYDEDYGFPYTLTWEAVPSLSGSEAALGFGRGDEDYGATITKLHRRIDNRKKQIAQDRERLAALEKALAEQITVNADVRRQMRDVQARCYALERRRPYR